MFEEELELAAQRRSKRMNARSHSATDRFEQQQQKMITNQILEDKITAKMVEE